MPFAPNQGVQLHTASALLVHVFGHCDDGTITVAELVRGSQKVRLDSIETRNNQAFCI